MGEHVLRELGPGDYLGTFTSPFELPAVVAEFHELTQRLNETLGKDVFAQSVHENRFVEFGEFEEFAGFGIDDADDNNPPVQSEGSSDAS
jgi:hypothetical protein